MRAVEHSRYMIERHVLSLLRQPWLIIITLLQPMAWLLLFGALFQRIVELPGFAAESYIEFLTPGVVVMTALMSSAWSGMQVIEDIDRGVLDRLLISPVHRGSLIIGRAAYQAGMVIIQSLIIIALGLALGARYPGGIIGITILVLGAVLVGIAFGGLSNALGITLRRGQVVVTAVNVLVLPLTFMASAFMPRNLMPEWMQTATLINPVDWAVEASRQALGAATDWEVVATRSAYLLAFAIVCSWLATYTFRSYQSSV
ncbi:MAG: ABC transporter permease [Pseudonocardiaceae bacterium]